MNYEKAKKGKYKPQHPEKYRGNPTNIIYRSLMELNTMKWLDTNTNVAWWSSEEFWIPYRCRTDNRVHRYFVDFLVGIKRGEKIETWMIEVKPFTQTQEPKKKQGKKQQTFITEVMTYAKNVSKWEAAEAYCKDRDWTFKIFTEREIYGRR